MSIPLALAALGVVLAAVVLMWILLRITWPWRVTHREAEHEKEQAFVALRAALRKQSTALDHQLEDIRGLNALLDVHRGQRKEKNDTFPEE